jgi:hypothetical protein
MNIKNKYRSHSLPLILCLFLLACSNSGKDNAGGQNGQTSSGQKIVFAPSQLTCCWDALLETTKKNNLDYNAQLQKALSGDVSALETVIMAAKKLDLGLSLTHGAVLATLLYAVGDKQFAQTLKSLEEKGELKQEQAIFQETMKETLRNALESGYSFTTAKELKGLTLQDFPQTATLLGYNVQGSH